MFERHLELTCLSSISPQVREKFYVSADEHTTNIERVLCVYRVYRALVHRSPTHVRRPSGVLLTFTVMRRVRRTILNMFKIIVRGARRTKTNGHESKMLVQRARRTSNE